MNDMTSSPQRIQRALDFVVDPINSVCGCMGPQRDEPRCPCQMNTVIRWKGVWIDLMPIRGAEPTEGYLDALTPSIEPERPLPPPMRVIRDGGWLHKTDLGPQIRDKE